jgi:hypothetical protein
VAKSLDTVIDSSQRYLEVSRECALAHARRYKTLNLAIIEYFLSKVIQTECL